VEDFLQALAKAMEEFDIHPRILFNFDETWLNGQKSSEKTARYRGGLKPVRELPKDPAEHVTLGLVCNAYGDSHKEFKTLAIFPLACLPTLSTQVTDEINVAVSQEQPRKKKR
jgi:hypothetical protein